MRMLYTFFIHCYTLAILVASFFNQKAALWINGRKGWRKKMLKTDAGNLPIFWFHCASLGEFEQARPLIETLKAAQTCKIMLTFFSPSGFEVRKDYALADHVMYLPADTIANAEYFIARVKPKAAFFIKYEFWFNYLCVLKKNGIPVFLVSGIFRKTQHFFKWYGTWFARQLGAFTYFFVQNESSFQLLKKINFTNAEVTGDTRFDRVFQVMQQNHKYAAAASFVLGSTVCVAGSTYTEDEVLLKHLTTEATDQSLPVKLIIAPHVVNEQRYNEIAALFGEQNCIRFSKFTEKETNRQVMIIDNMGMLSSLYTFADFAYIGGGFGKGIHNTLEAAVYGIPLLFGSNYNKFDEAKALLSERAAFSVNNKNEIKHIGMKLLKDEKLRKEAGRQAALYVQSGRGAVEKIMHVLRTKAIIS